MICFCWTWQSSVGKLTRIRPTLYISSAWISKAKIIFSWRGSQPFDLECWMELGQHSNYLTLGFPSHLYLMNAEGSCLPAVRQVGQKKNLSTFIEKSKTVFKYCEYLFANSFMFCYKFCCWSATSAMVQNISAAGVTTWDGWYEKSKFPIFKVNMRNQKFCDVESCVDSVRNQKFHNAILKLKVNMISGNSKLQFLK